MTKNDFKKWLSRNDSMGNKNNYVLTRLTVGSTIAYRTMTDKVCTEVLTRSTEQTGTHGASIHGWGGMQGIKYIELNGIILLEIFLSMGSINLKVPFLKVAFILNAHPFCQRVANL